MERKVKIRAKAKDGMVDVKCLLSHPMESGMRKDKKTGEKIPAHFIQEVTIALNGAVFATSNLSGMISKNPYLRFKTKGKKDDVIKVDWVDNKGESGSGEGKAK